jgi:hypothetical protein
MEPLEKSQAEVGTGHVGSQLDVVSRQIADHTCMSEYWEVPYLGLLRIVRDT